MPTRVQSQRLNYLEKVIKVQITHNEVYEEGLTKKYIHIKYIRSQYNISYKTYLAMLAINARREKKELEKTIHESENQHQTDQNAGRISAGLFGAYQPE